MHTWKWSGAFAALLTVTTVARPAAAAGDDDYAAAAKAVATPLYGSADSGVRLDRNFSHEFSRMATTLDRLNKCQPSDAELLSAHRALSTQAAKSSAYLYKIAEADNLAPLGMEVMKKSIPFVVNKSQSNEEKFDLGFALGQLIGNRINRYSLRTEYRSSTHDMRVAAATFADQARRFAGYRAAADRYGIGAVMEVRDGTVTVGRVLPDSPAAKAGLKAGDQLFAADGTNFGGKSLAHAIDLVRGDKDSEARLLVRSGTEAAREVKVPRELKLDVRPIGIDLDSSWNGIFSSDDLSLTNHSGKALTRVTIRVTTHDGSDVRRHLHYLDRWERADTFVAVYKGEQEYVATETHTDIDKVTVEVWCDQFTTTAEYGYYGAERDRDIEKYCKQLTFTGAVVDAYENFFVTRHKGVELEFRGLPRIRPAAVTVTMKGAANSQSLRWAFSRDWDAGGGLDAETFRDARFNNISPTGYEIEIEFPRSEYRHKVYWVVK